MAKNQSNSFYIQTSASGVLVNAVQIKKQNEFQTQSLPINVKFENKTANVQISGCEDFDSFFNKFSADVLLMHTTEKNMNIIFNSFEQLISNYEILIKKLMPDHLKNQISSLISTGTKFVIDNIKSLNSAKKRQKLLEKNVCYVPPIDCGIGLDWQVKRQIGTDLRNDKLVQPTFQYIPIIETIKSLFKNPRFNQSYFEFNENPKHACINDKFQGFCCGSIYKKHSVFTPTTIRLHLGMDETEPCAALKTKTGLHKQYAVYLQIDNIDPIIKSKLGNIHLVALANSADLKACDSDKVVKKIVEDLKILETEGITLQTGQNLKAILTNVCSDNLGANSTFGFVECFNARYFCRMCELTAAECKVATEENNTKLRQKQSYSSIVEGLNECESADFKATIGIKKPCAFNELQYFHILDNCTVDVMHDMLEGVVPFFIHFIFDNIISKKIANLDKIQSLCRDYNYGWLWSKYKPSAIKLNLSTTQTVCRTRINQNAMQNYCLLLNLPFILYDMKDKLESEWRSMENLLQAMQIIFSSSIRQTDIDRLRILIKCHLSYLVDAGQNLLPKHHNTTHYPRLITVIGPPINSWMMRYESKHKFFTDLVHLTYNYKNIPLTLAKRHQARACVGQTAACSVDVVISKTTYEISKCDGYEEYESFLPAQLQKIKAFRFIRIGSYEYRAGLMLIDERSVFEIIHCISYNSKYFFLCQKYKVIRFVANFNSIEIDKENVYKLIDYSSIENHKSYDKIYFDGKMYIIADTLNVFNEF